MKNELHPMTMNYFNWLLGNLLRYHEDILELKFTKVLSKQDQDQIINECQRLWKQKAFL